MQVPLTTKMMKAGAMALKAVVSGVPKSVRDRELLEEDLRRIGCHGFAGKPWGLQMEDLMVELLRDKDNNRWDGTVRQALEKWTAKEWRKVYNFGRGGEDFADKMEELLDEMRILFDGLLPEVPPVAAENLPDISGEIQSLTGWRKDGTTKTPTKPDQPGPSEPS